VLPPVLQVAVLVLTNAFELPDVDASNATLDTLLNDVFGETVEEVGSTLRPFMMQPSDVLTS
jgi:hypothetical protein